jgi:hypothetical protein
LLLLLRLALRSLVRVWLVVLALLGRPGRLLNWSGN